MTPTAAPSAASTALRVIAEPPRPLSAEEEFANRLTHAIGLAMSLVGAAYLLSAMARYGDPLQIVGASVYAVTLVAMYAASTLSHSFETPKWRHLFRTLDQVCIFLLIAGTFTPIALRYMQGGWWWALFAAVWALSLAGIIAKLFFTRLRNVAIGVYVLVGWLPLVAIKPMVQIVPLGVTLWLLTGGLLYTLGTLFLIRDEKVRYFHAVWHVLVIAASACHYYVVMAFVVPWPM